MCKGPVVGVSLVCSRTGEESTGVAGVGVSTGDGRRQEKRAQGGGWERVP